MAYFYVVAKTQDDYDLIKIDNGDSLEDIDLYTTKFKTKENFIRHVNNKGLSLDKNVDLFIACKGKNKKNEDILICKELVYDNKEIEELAIKSKAGRIDNSAIFGKYFKILQNSRKLKLLHDKECVHFYDKLKTALDDSEKSGKLEINGQTSWLRKNYMAGRDILYALEIYDQNKVDMDEEQAKNLAKENNDLYQDRCQIAQALMMKIKNGFDQLLMVDEPAHSIELTYINKDLIKEIESLEVKHDSEIGELKEDTQVQVEVEEKIPEETTVDEIFGFLTDTRKMPIGSIKENYNEETKKTTYDINYDKLESTFNVEYTDEEKKEINKLLGVDVKRNLFLAQMYSDDNHKYSPSSQKEARYYKSKVYAALDKYSKKQPKMYEKAQEFCKIQSEKIREVKRGGHGSR